MLCPSQKYPQSDLKLLVMAELNLDHEAMMKADIMNIKGMCVQNQILPIGPANEKILLFGKVW